MWRSVLENTRLSMWQGNVCRLLFDGDGTLCGVATSEGAEFHAPRVVLTAGTFLNGLMHIGRQSFEGGRISEPAAHGVTEQLSDLGIRTDRMKTARRCVSTAAQSTSPGQRSRKATSATSCSATFRRFAPNCASDPATSHIPMKNTCEVLRRGLLDSPLYNGQIQSIGPRYCPSIETKIVTFADRTQHQLFLEPEGEETQEYYLNGFSSSMPLDIQVEALRTVPATRKCPAVPCGYAIEYDFFDPTQLHPHTGEQGRAGLYLAGQVNGTTGYEEAAARDSSPEPTPHLPNREKPLWCSVATEHTSEYLSTT